MKNSKWYIIDFNQECGHDVIYQVDVECLSAARVDNKPGFKLELKSGDIIFVDQASAHVELELAKEDYLNKIEEMKKYAETFVVFNKILQLEVSISEKDKK